jgi:CRP-like cAMP-binding protein
MNKFTEFILQYINLDQQEIVAFENNISQKTYHPNEVILDFGQTCENILFVCSGSARSYFVDPLGKEYIWNFHFNDHDSTFENYFILDYNSFVQQIPTPLTFQVINKLEVLELRYDKLQQMLEHSPKIQALVRIMTEKAYSHLHVRTFSLLTKSAKERYLQLLKEEPYLLNKFQHYHVASYLGVVPQSFSRLRKEIFEK